jgi:poly(3-hydroxybutyrate) depolymerase
VPTVSAGNACDLTASPYIGNCNYDWAGSMLQHLYGQLNPRNGSTLSGQILEFAQSDFVAGNPWLAGMSNYGYAYVPASCTGGAQCKVHVSFHGCKQFATEVGDAYYTKTGLNEYADTNNMIVLYPQTVATTVTPFNPNGCWDWWGYGSSHYADKQGPQIAAVRGMLTRLAANYMAGVPPLGTFGAPSGLVAGDKTHDRVALRWTPVFGAAGYKAYRATSAAGPFALINSNANAGASFVDSARVPATSYYYQVTAVSGSGVESAASAPVAAVTAAAPNSCDPWYADNVTHVSQFRAYVLYGLTYAYGSNSYMGLWATTVSTQLRKVGASYYVGTCS